MNNSGFATKGAMNSSMHVNETITVIVTAMAASNVSEKIVSESSVVKTKLYTTNTPVNDCQLLT